MINKIMELVERATPIARKFLPRSYVLMPYFTQFLIYIILAMYIYTYYQGLFTLSLARGESI